MLQIPFLRQCDGGVPVDGLGNLDGDGDGHGMHDAGLVVLPRDGFQEQGVEGVDLSDKLR